MSVDSKLEYTREYQKKIPFLQHLKIRTDELGEGSARLSLAGFEAVTRLCPLICPGPQARQSHELQSHRGWLNGS